MTNINEKRKWRFGEAMKGKKTKKNFMQKSKKQKINVS
jgi:hypothetical protein